jgi:twitching motility protein PilT
VTPAIRELIMDGKRIGEVRDYIEEGRDQYGMQTFDQALADLVHSREVTFEVAKAAASNPSDFDLKMRMFSRISGGVQASSVPTDAAPTPASPGTPVDGIQIGSGLDFMNQ